MVVSEYTKPKSPHSGSSYYQIATQPEDTQTKNGPLRVSASKLETAVFAAVKKLEPSSDQRLTLTDDAKLAEVTRVDVTADGATLTLADNENRIECNQVLHVPIDWNKSVRRGIRLPSAGSPQSKADKCAHRKRQANERLSKAIASAHRHYELIKNGEVQTIAELASRENRSIRAIRLNLNLAWLSPDIVQAALDGELNASISATELARTMPNDWQQQCRLVGLTG